MPDTPGKRQRREVKARKRQAKDDRRAARHEPRDEANPDDDAFEVHPTTDEVVEDAPSIEGSVPPDQVV